MTMILGGRYELVEQIGAGGMARVWRGWSSVGGAFRRPVAIKELLPYLADDDAFAAMFAEEARVISQLHHPNIVATYDFGTDDHGSYIIMEYLPGIDMGKWILHHARTKQRSPWGLSCAIIMDVLRALGAAHEGLAGKPRVSAPDMISRAPVYHRDVTPTNVLLGEHGSVKLGDFGLARAMDRVTMTSPGVVKGKLSYVAPEILGGTRSNHATDLYSLGIILWETLAMRRLFEGVADLELFVKVGEGNVPSLRTERPDVPPGIHDALERMVAKHPGERFPSAHAALSAFDAVMRRESEIVTPEDLAQSVAEVLDGAVVGKG